MVIIWLGTKYTLIEKQPFPFEYEKKYIYKSLSHSAYYCAKELMGVLYYGMIFTFLNEMSYYSKFQLTSQKFRMI